MQNPKISVIIPVYNGSNVVSVPFEGLRNQTFKDFEMIFINDGSKDNSLEVLNEFKKIDDRVVVFNNENIGQHYSYLFGLKYARSNYVVLMTHDDSMETELLEKLYNVVLHDESIDVVIAPVKYFNENKDIFSVRLPEKTINNFTDMYKKFFFNQFYNDIHHKLIKKDVYLKFYNENMVDSWINLYVNSKTYFMNDAFGLVWGDYSRCSSWAKSKKRLKEIIDIMTFFAKKNLVNFSKNYNEPFLFFYTDYICYVFTMLFAKNINTSVTTDIFLDISDFKKFDFKKFKQNFSIQYYIFFFHLLYTYQQTESKRLREILDKIFFDEKDAFDINLIELNINLSIMANFFVALKNIKNEINIYGAGQNLEKIINLFNRFNIQIKHIIISNANGENKFGYKLVKLQDAYKNDISVPVFINSITYYNDIEKNIKDFNKSIIISNPANNYEQYFDVK